jgi:hypothetical protein
MGSPHYVKESRSLWANARIIRATRSYRRLFYDDLIMDRQACDRTAAFDAVRLVPLESIAGDFVHPVLGLSIRELLQHVDTSGIVPA